MIIEDLTLYNDFFESLDSFKCIKSFKYNREDKVFEGEIKFNNTISFAVEIPESYPLGSLRFITKDFEGLPHQNFDGSLCLNTNFVNSIPTRLKLEIEKLRAYLKEYYQEEQIDKHYEYPACDTTGLANLVFQEGEIDYTRFEVPFGIYKYSIIGLNQDSKGKISQLTALAQGLGNKDYKWSEYYKSKHTYFGAWVFIGKEPVYKKKHRITNWTDLSEMLPERFAIFFDNFCNRFANYKLHPKEFDSKVLLAIGYSIPSSEGLETHWDLILLPRKDFPKRSTIPGGLLMRYTKAINWDKTHNAAYNRFFGRGALENKLATSKVLVIGNGAIGSALAEILVRGGARNIDLSDIDSIEPGNICRSTFAFDEVTFSKSAQLQQRLRQISPFVHVNVDLNIKPTSVRSSDYKETLEKLSSYDVIFDCTANNEIVQMLTDFRLSNLVFYISLSNNAKEMVCVTNADNPNIIERRNQMLYSFGTFIEPEFREGTGCWHPTFSAAYFDINQLLNYTIKKIDNFFKQDVGPKSFYTFYKEDCIGCSEDIKFFQKDLGLTLTMESAVFKKIEGYARNSYPNEFGGMLMGSYLNDYIDLVISDIIIPKNYKSSSTTFEPDHKELNEKLSAYYKTYKDKVVYVGEWHSHPNGTSFYSQPDFNSIRNIALSKKVNIHNPILLIAAFGLDYFEPGFYVFKNDRLYRFNKV